MNFTFRPNIESTRIAGFTNASPGVSLAEMPSMREDDDQVLYLKKFAFGFVIPYPYCLKP